MSATETVIRFSVNPGLSRFTVQAFASGLFSALGHNPKIAIRDYSGDLAFSPSSPQDSNVRITAKGDSFEVTDDVSAKDRAEIDKKMKQDVLETSQYPEIAFESTQMSVTKTGDANYMAQVTGNLTLHGVTRAVTIPAQVSVTGDSLRAYGEFSLLQTDYGIALISVAAGALKVKDEVKLSFDLTARKI